MNSAGGVLLESKVQKYSAGRHFIHVSGIKVIGIVISNKFIINGKYSANGRGEFKVVEVEVYSEPNFVIIVIGGHSELSIVIIIRIIFITGKI